MTSSDPLDDGWAELARELNLPEPARPPQPDTTPGVMPPSEAVAMSGTPDPELAEPTDETPEPADDDGEYADGEGGDDAGDEADGDGTSEGGEGEAGGKKRRRRRRRRRGKKGPGEETAAEGERTATEAADENAEAEEEVGEVPVGVSAEDTTPEMAREIIANWNVPSWDEIIAGLYRPER